MIMFGFSLKELITLEKYQIIEAKKLLEVLF